MPKLGGGRMQLHCIRASSALLRTVQTRSLFPGSPAAPGPLSDPLLDDQLAPAFVSLAAELIALSGRAGHW